MANEWNKTALVMEFETMLRRRLRNGAAPVVACAGFDLNAASAYLEDALGGSQRAGYESHLAGCATCRRHLIELARLARCAPQAEAQPATTPDRIPARDRWKEAIAGWFDISTWNLKWQMAGATGAAFAILIAALVVQSSRQDSNQAAKAIVVSATPPTTPESVVQPATAEPSTLDPLSIVAANSSAIQQAQSPNPAPLPPITLRVGETGIELLPSSKSLAPGVNQSIEPPVVARPDGAEARAAQETSDRASSSVLDFREKETAQGLRITPPSKDNPMNLEPPEPDQGYESLALGRMPQVNSKPESLPQPQPPRSKLEGAIELMKRTLSPLGKRSFNTSEPERKTKSDKREEPNDETPKSMQRMIRDKIFCFEKCKGPDLEKIRGTWIDREYDFEMQKWNIWTLKRGSEEYKKVLANEPRLEEFFDEAPILIVWKNRIYKVLK